MLCALTFCTLRASLGQWFGKDGKVWIDGKATVIMADVKASNGVIHAIDTVLMPVEMVLRLKGAGEPVWLSCAGHTPMTRTREARVGRCR